MLYSYYGICVYRVAGASGSLMQLSFKETVEKSKKFRRSVMKLISRSINVRSGHGIMCCAAI